MNEHTPCSRHMWCGNTADHVVPAPDGSDYPVCDACYNEPCGHCGNSIDRDENVAKGLCQDCRDRIRDRTTTSPHDDRTVTDNQTTLPTT